MKTDKDRRGRLENDQLSNGSGSLWRPMKKEKQDKR